MTEDEIERLAEAVFQKILSKQEEWEQQFYVNSDRDQLIADIVRLNVFKAEAVQSENYEKASELQKEINKLRELLNNKKLE